MGKIFYLMGKSASGKDTLYKRLLEVCPKLKTIILYTTRPMRDGETDGVEYYFTTPEVLQRFSEEGKMIELRTYETVSGPWSYATVDDGQVDLENEDYPAIGTLISYENMRNYYGEDHVIPLYIAVDDGVRLERALRRERQQKKPNYAELCRRFLADEKDFSKERLAACGIDRGYENNDFNTCIQLILKDIEAKGDK